MFSQIPIYLLFLISLILGAEGKRGGGGRKGGGRKSGSKSATGGYTPPKDGPVVMSGPGTRTDPKYPNVVFLGSGSSEYCREQKT